MAGNHVTDDEKWRIGLAAVVEEFAALDEARRCAVVALVHQIMAVKGEIAACFSLVDGAAVCAQCGGECCRAGRYHFTVIDLLAYLVAQRKLFTPSFDSGACPFIGGDGCLMEPQFRPYNCVTFVCDRVELEMAPGPRQDFNSLCDRLLTCYLEMEALLANRFRSGLLINCERYLDGKAAMLGAVDRFSPPRELEEK